MIDYFENNKNGTIIYKNLNSYEENCTCLTYIKRLCLNHLFTYEGYKKSISLLFNKRNLLPVVLNSELVLMPIKRTKNYDNIWVNIKAINKVVGHNKGVIIEFYSKRVLTLNISLNFYFNQVKLANLIETKKRKHFH